ncbi:class F sortase [Streptomyces griseiscabiei]|uniref:Class F sortase n=2 Tax=Streptomyces griseiscabiei TaxID=2993540 RepID=A0ABU4LFT0_9ACTN|nr:class F sortase [Streptomyces griseiscabiei]MDX2914160.1 class F sortase [Streptomyces griseiscabiei]
MTVVLVVGGVHLAEDRGRTGSAEASSAWAGTGARDAGAPRAQASLYLTPPPPDDPARAEGNASAGDAASAGPGEPADPAQRTAATTPTGPATPTAPATPTGPAPVTPAAPKPAAESVRPAPTPEPAEPKSPARPRTLPPSPARTVSVPYLGIEAPVTGLRLDARRRLPAPPDDKPKLVGWYTEGPAPGGPGTAVVVGHRDTRTGPAVFAALDVIKPGRVVEVLRADGRTAVYTVDAVKSYEKDRFPSKEVYGHRARPELRLITCGGTYDRRKGYASNVVVFAHLTATREPARKP